MVVRIPAGGEAVAGPGCRDGLGESRQIHVYAPFSDVQQNQGHDIKETF